MGDPGGPGSVRKCHGVALADLGDTEGFDKEGEENQLMFFSWLMGYTTEKRLPKRGRSNWKSSAM